MPSDAISLMHAHSTSRQSSGIGRALSIGLILLVIAGIVVSAYFAYFYQPAPKISGCNFTTRRSDQAYFVIVMSEQGYNGSVTHALPWPIMTVHLNQVVNFCVTNQDKAEPHGFTIDHYLTGGNALDLSPGQTAYFSFVANVAGNFTIFCQIYCAVHVFMVSRLVVLPS